MVARLLLTALTPQLRPLQVAEHEVSVSIDSCRADRFDILGYPRTVTPNIEHWAASCEIFSRINRTSAQAEDSLLEAMG